eukprot:gene43233-52846_t
MATKNLAYSLYSLVKANDCDGVALFLRALDKQGDLVSGILDFRFADKTYCSLLSCAVARGNARIVRLLCMYGCDASGSDALSLAAETGHPAMLHALADDFSVDVCVKSEEHGRNALLMAVNKGQHAASLSLLARRLSPFSQDAFGVSALLLAIHRGQWETLRFLLSHFEVDCDVRCAFRAFSPVLLCAQRNEREALRALLRHSPRLLFSSACALRRTPFMYACARGHVDMVRDMLRLAHDHSHLAWRLLNSAASQDA